MPVGPGRGRRARTDSDGGCTRTHWQADTRTSVGTHLFEVALHPIGDAERPREALLLDGEERLHHLHAARGVRARAARERRVEAQRVHVAVRLMTPCLVRHDHVDARRREVLEDAAVDRAPEVGHRRQGAKVLGLDLRGGVAGSGGDAARAGSGLIRTAR